MAETGSIIDRDRFTEGLSGGGRDAGAEPAASEGSLVGSGANGKAEAYLA